MKMRGCKTIASVSASAVFVLQFFWFRFCGSFMRLTRFQGNLGSRKKKEKSKRHCVTHFHFGEFLHFCFVASPFIYCEQRTGNNAPCWMLNVGWKTENGGGNDGNCELCLPE